MQFNAEILCLKDGFGKERPASKLPGQKKDKLSRTAIVIFQHLKTTYDL
jgi:hypothetical protein